MSFDVSALDAYVKQNTKEIATQAIIESTTAKLLLDNGAAQIGVKGSTSVLTLNNSVTFSDGSTCTRVVSDDIIFSDRKLTVKPLRNNVDLCMKDLYNTALVETLSQGQYNETMDSAVYQKIVNDRAMQIAAKIEQLIWKGDTSLTGTNNLKWIDGFLKIITAEGVTLTLTGSDVIAKLQSAYAQMSVIHQDADDFKIFMGKETYNSLKLGLYNKNLFNPGAELTIPGTDGMIQVVSGLNGTNKIVGTRISNLQLGVDGTDDSSKAVFKYDEFKDLAAMDFHFAIGVQVVFPSEAYVASLV